MTDKEEYQQAIDKMLPRTFQKDLHYDIWQAARAIDAKRITELEEGNKVLIDALNYLMQAFDNEVWNCPNCGHAEETSTMDSAIYLREFLAKVKG